MIRRGLKNVEELEKLEKLKKLKILLASSVTAAIFLKSELAFSFFSDELNIFLA
jgi:hypothetical protein